MAKYRLASWEKESFNICKEDTWGSIQGTLDTWYRYRETSGSIPMGFKPRQNAGALGLGLSYPKASNFHVGKATGVLSATFPLTPVTLNDLASLFVQSAHAGDDFQAYTTPEVTLFASISPELGARGTDVVVSGTSFLLRGMNVTIPQNSPGDTGGIVEVSTDWIGHSASIGDDTIVSAAPTADAGVFLQTRNCTFKIGGATKDLISASINMSNNAAMYPDAESTPTGASLGPLNVTGSVTVAGVTDSVGDTSHDLLLAEIEAATVTAQQLEFNWAEDSASQEIQLYVAIMSITGPTDIGGMQAWTYNFELAGDASTNPLKMHGGGSGETLADALFYVA